MRTKLKWAMALLFVAGAGLFGPRAALAEGSATGDLGAGGTVAGDISMAAGEEDRIGVDLAEGQVLDVTFSAAFTASVRLVDPQGAAVAAEFGSGKKTTVKGLRVTATGRHEFRVSSADGTQGVYSLLAKPSWPKVVTVEGTTPSDAPVLVGRGSSVKGTVVTVPAKAFTPRVVSFTSPGGADLLAAPAEGKNGVARFAVVASETGSHRLAIDAASGGGAFRCAMKVKAPRVALRKVDVRNGLSGVSFEADGVGALLKSRCVECHAWAGSYAAARPFAKAAASRVRKGNMPQGGQRLAAAEVALIDQWARTGTNP